MDDIRRTHLNPPASASEVASAGSLARHHRAVAAAWPWSVRRSPHVRSVYQRVAGRYDRYYRRAWLAVAGGAAENVMLAHIIPVLSDRASPLVLDAGGREVLRASGLPKKAEVLAALGQAVAS